MFKKLVWLAINVTVIYFVYHISFLQGVLKEREGKVCVGEYELSTYEKTLNIASQICIGVQSYKQKELADCQKESVKYKNNYYSLKKQQVATTTVTLN